MVVNFTCLTLYKIVLQDFNGDWVPTGIWTEVLGWNKSANRIIALIFKRSSLSRKLTTISALDRESAYLFSSLLVCKLSMKCLLDFSAKCVRFLKIWYRTSPPSQPSLPRAENSLRSLKKGLALKAHSKILSTGRMFWHKSASESDYLVETCKLS